MRVRGFVRDAAAFRENHTWHARYQDPYACGAAATSGQIARCAGIRRINRTFPDGVSGCSHTEPEEIIAHVSSAGFAAHSTRRVLAGDVGYGYVLLGNFADWINECGPVQFLGKLPAIGV